MRGSKRKLDIGSGSAFELDLNARKPSKGTSEGKAKARAPESR